MSCHRCVANPATSSVDPPVRAFGPGLPDIGLVTAFELLRDLPRRETGLIRPKEHLEDRLLQAAQAEGLNRELARTVAAQGPNSLASSTLIRAAARGAFISNRDNCYWPSGPAPP